MIEDKSFYVAPVYIHIWLELLVAYLADNSKL